MKFLKTKRNKIILIVLFIFLLNLFLLKKVGIISHEHFLLKKEFIELSKKIDFFHKEKIYLTSANFQDKFSKIDKSFIKIKDLVTFINYLEKITKDTNNSIKIRSIDFSENYFIFDFTIISGDISNFSYFLSSLENSSDPYYPIEIDNIDIIRREVSGSGEAKEIKIEANFKIKVFS